MRLRVGDGLDEAVVAERELAADVDEREVAADRVRRDDDALDELVRVALDEHAVLERRRFAFVAVHHEVAREDALREERPLLAAREVRAAAAAQTRTPRPAPGRRRGRRPRARRLQRVVATGRERAVDRPRVVGPLVQPLRDDARSSINSPWLPEIVRAGSAPRLYCSTIVVRELRRELLVELVVHLHRRRAAARGEALDFFDGRPRRRARTSSRGARGSSGPPVTRHVTFVHTDTSNRPHGRRLNIV